MIFSSNRLDSLKVQSYWSQSRNPFWVRFNAFSVFQQYHRYQIMKCHSLDVNRLELTVGESSCDSSGSLFESRNGCYLCSFNAYIRRKAPSTFIARIVFQRKDK
mmetsp:Transcript_17271/g.43095  ORF Transcript_17271/g.43095 Transcript_17271/m.43095 type:complete len:104 (+) Transcript_17271:2983-3294(+)